MIPSTVLGVMAVPARQIVSLYPLFPPEEEDDEEEEEVAGGFVVGGTEVASHSSYLTRSYSTFISARSSSRSDS